MNTKHTPGPWEMRPRETTIRTGDMYADDGFTSCVDGFDVFGPDDRPIVGPHGVPALDTDEHNARLIAAAPVLLEALQSIMRHGELANIDKGGPFGSGGKKPPSMDAWVFPRHLLNDIEAAISSAQGEAS